MALERRYGLPLGEESSGARASGIWAEQVGVAPAGERGGVLGAEIANAASDRFKLGDAVVDPALGSVQRCCYARANGLVRAAEVGTRKPIDLLDREPERSQSGDDLRAPQCGLVEQAVVALATAGRVDQTETFVAADRPDREPGAARQLADRHELLFAVVVDQQRLILYISNA